MTEKPQIDVRIATRLKELMPTIILASGSPNRRQLLEECGVTVIQKPQDINEMCGLSEPKACVEKLSSDKLQSYISTEGMQSPHPVVAVDTLVYNDGRLIGKPQDIHEARAMLHSFSGRCQQVWSGLSVLIDGVQVTNASCSLVFFNKLDNEAVSEYLATGEWQGAAGGYRIQKTGYTLIDHITGSWSNVVGLPIEVLVRVAEALRNAHGQA